MDYSDFKCQHTFTQGQVDRMRIALTTLRVSLLSSDGCKVVTGVDNKLKIENGELKMKVFPNPTDGKLFIKDSYGMTGKDLKIRVLDMLGRVVLVNEIPAFAGMTARETGMTKGFELDISDLNKGVYVVEVEGVGRGMVVKL